jgi:hypothetical protein
VCPLNNETDFFSERPANRLENSVWLRPLGRPFSARSNEDVEKARAIEMKDRRITTRLLAERLKSR